MPPSRAVSLSAVGRANVPIVSSTDEVRVTGMDRGVPTGVGSSAALDVATGLALAARGESVRGACIPSDACRIIDR